MKGEELYTSGRKWVFYITSRKLFSLPLQIKWSLQRHFLLSVLRSGKKSVFVFISWLWCFGSLEPWSLFFYKLTPDLWWTSFPLVSSKNLLVLKSENNGPLRMKLCVHEGYNWVGFICLLIYLLILWEVCRVRIGTSPKVVRLLTVFLLPLLHNWSFWTDLRQIQLVSTIIHFPFHPWIWGCVWWKLLRVISV